MPEHPFTLEKFFIILSQLNCSRNIQMKPFSANAMVCNVPIVYHIYLELQRWFINCLTVKFALALSGRIVGVEKMFWDWEHFSLMKVFSFSSLSRFCIEVKDSALLVTTWRIKRQGFLSSIGTRLCCMSSIVAPGKLRALTTQTFSKPFDTLLVILFIIKLFAWINVYFFFLHFWLQYQNIVYLKHSHKKGKDSLEGSLDWILFAAELEFSKILVPRLPRLTSNVNAECAKKWECTVLLLWCN